jgi:hypothetical protein
VEPPESLGFPLDRIPEGKRGEIEEILSDAAAIVPLEETEVRSRPEVYDFLLSEMPFTGSIVRELRKGRWSISRDPSDPEPGAFRVQDDEGMRLRFVLVGREETRRLYLTKGSFPLGLLPALRGRTLIVMRAVPDGPVIRTDAVVYVKVDTPFYATMAKGLRGVVEKVVREKSSYFIQAAQWVAEEAAARPGELHRRAQGSSAIDQDVLERFREKFLGP